MVFGRTLAGHAINFCVSLCLGLTIYSAEIVSAQAQSKSSDPLGDLMKQFGSPDGDKSIFSEGLFTQESLDEARKPASLGIVRSPFSSQDGSLSSQLNTQFTIKELFLIDKFCQGDSSDTETQLAKIMSEFSKLERDYCSRISNRILQIGYNVFDGNIVPELLVNGTIKDDYILGIGDELVVTYEGKSNNVFQLVIGREGRLSHQSFGRLLAAGKSVGHFRKDLKERIAKTQIGTEVYLSMGAVRQIVVRVTGEVRKPGLHRSTGLSTLFDALSLAGGIKKTGSLRRVQVQRGDNIFWLDVYELMFPQFGGQDSVLQDGDHILVPAIGNTIAVTGDVKRAGIFELSEGRNSASVRQAIEFAGGYLRSKGNVLAKLSFDSSGREIISQLSGPDATIEDGDVLVVRRMNSSKIGMVSLAGHVTNPGEKSITAFPTVRSLLLVNNGFSNNPYLLFGVLETTDPSTLARRYFPLNLQNIVDGKKDYALRDKDRLIVFSQEEIRYLSSDDVRMTIVGITDPIVELDSISGSSANNDSDGSLAARLAKSVNLDARMLNGIKSGGRENDSDTAKADKTRENDNGRESEKLPCNGLRSLRTILQLTRSSRFASVVQALGGAASIKSVNPRDCPGVFDKNSDLLPFVLEHSVAVNGEVRMPGVYPVGSGAPVSSLIASAGGMTIDADITNVEISRFGQGKVLRQNYDFSKTQFHSVTVQPGDLARFNGLFKARDSGPVLLSGEFTRPGLYDIRRGERLSEVIERAGGITDQAFPYGAVFTRERVRIAQRAAFKRAARELKSSAMYAAGQKGANPSALIALQDLTEEISNTESVGRVVIEADPIALQVRPELDTVLEPGDKIYMPKRPNSVLVIGDILNPGALQFVAGTKVDQYVQQAGGLQISADEDRMFLVFPNGVAKPVSVSVWNYNPVRVPPGSTVVVPKDPVPMNIFEFAKDMTTLLSQMAITAASLAVIGNN
jgi:polysaccharide biosynthesis/export protein